MMMRNETCASLWVPGPLPGLNELIAAAKGSGGRGAGYARLKRQWTETVWALAKAACIDKPGPFARPVTLDFTWIERDKRRDPDNVAAGGRKLILDGLVTAGVLGGDGWRHVQGWTDRWRTDPERFGCALSIVVVPATVMMGEAIAAARR
jgi:hypothetical protein